MNNLTSTDRIAIMRALNSSIAQWDELIAYTKDEKRKQLYIDIQNEEKKALEKMREW